MMKFTLPQEISQQFHIERVLKTHETGTVLLLRHQHTGQRHVCKQFQGDPTVCRLLSEYPSPHLPAMEGVWEQEGMVTTLEEYIQGDTLAFLLEGGPIPEAQAREIILQLCTALELLHSLDIVHRDIKPENVILRGDTAVLIDFNASRVEKRGSSADTQIMGTAGYAAPEQYGFSQTDARSDIYALGVLLNVLLTKQHPASQLAEGPLQPIICTCIEVNADRRYATAAQLSEALRTCRQTKKKGKPFLWAAIAIPTLLIMALLAVLLPHPSENAPYTPTPISVPISPIPFVEESLDTQSVQIIGGNYQAMYGMGPVSFTYDLDEDGTSEPYLFGLTYTHPGIFAGDVIIAESNGLDNADQSPTRSAIPCVWGYDEHGGLQVCDEFAPLLTDCSITLFKQDAPAATAVITDFHHTWKGGIAVEFSPDPIGTWIYTVSAKLDGKQLTATSATINQIVTEEMRQAIAAQSK